MKKFFLFIICIFFLIFLFNDEKSKIKMLSLSSEAIELKEKYPIKEYHEKLSLECIHCHEEQGSDPMKFSYVDDEICHKCHGDQRKIVNRLSYMNVLFSNPHDSLHSKTVQKLPCNECHHSHEPSENSCAVCHPSRALQWMKEFPE